MKLRELLRLRPLPLIMFCAAGVVTGIAIARGGRLVRGDSSMRSSAAQDITRVPVAGTFHREVVMFFGSEACYACRLPTVPERVRMIVDSLRRDALLRKMPFSSVGVALDGAPKLEVKWLERYGTFDEVAVGGNWYNTVVQRYIWAEPAATAGLPQLVLLRQRVSASERRIRIDSEAVVHRWLGAGDIAPGLKREASAMLK